ncbi:hypothetical protein LCGC14_0347570 [marine sediment metagenome]|uniref:Uncharacterized protein n=1 Tax=marine sediment metagenome TaxID=412755 RepID=A0A0F9TBP3_9ZZZZ
MIYSGRAPNQRTVKELLNRQRELKEQVKESESFGCPVDELRAELVEVNEEVLARQGRI